jgi:hypothetical protein
MSKIEYKEVKPFAVERVNLPKKTADKHRAQVSALRDRLGRKIDNTSFGPVKMLYAGTTATGTALRTVSNPDVAVPQKDIAELRPRILPDVAFAFGQVPVGES